VGQTINGKSAATFMCVTILRYSYTKPLCLWYRWQKTAKNFTYLKVRPIMM